MVRVIPLEGDQPAVGGNASLDFPDSAPRAWSTPVTLGRLRSDITSWAVAPVSSMLRDHTSERGHRAFDCVPAAAGVCAKISDRPPPAPVLAPSEHGSGYSCLVNSVERTSELCVHSSRPPSCLWSP